MPAKWIDHCFYENSQENIEGQNLTGNLGTDQVNFAHNLIMVI
jgi:hypothetical protein